MTGPDQYRARWLVETDQLAARLDAPDLVVVDGSWYLPQQKRDPKAEYLDGHIPGAVFFDIDDISDTDSPLPHMLPGADKFASRMRRLGIGDGQRIVVYDGLGLMSAARVWWMFRAMGVEDVQVLNGGLPKWIAEERPVETGAVKRMERHFSARRNTTAVRSRAAMERNVGVARELVLDARSAGRFNGVDPEPREGLRSGHIPGSRNLPFQSLIAQGGTLADTQTLDTALRGAGWSPGMPVATTCGSGVTAAIITLALAVLGEPLGGLYDGSWADWGQSDGPPIETAST